MNESEPYKELGILIKDKDKWEENIPYVSSLLAHDSVKIQAKALWLLGEMGLAYPLLQPGHPGQGHSRAGPGRLPGGAGAAGGSVSVYGARRDRLFTNT